MANTVTDKPIEAKVGFGADTVSLHLLLAVDERMAKRNCVLELQRDNTAGENDGNTQYLRRLAAAINGVLVSA